MFPLLLRREGAVRRALCASLSGPPVPARPVSARGEVRRGSVRLDSLKRHNAPRAAVLCTGSPPHPAPARPKSILPDQVPTGALGYSSTRNFPCRFWPPNKGKTLGGADQ